MKITRSTEFADCYEIENAPAAGPVEAGAVWVISLAHNKEAEATIRLADLSEAQALAFETNEEYEAFKAQYGRVVSFDYSQFQEVYDTNPFVQVKRLFETWRSCVALREEEEA